jgi:hypothetical protein
MTMMSNGTNAKRPWVDRLAYATLYRGRRLLSQNTYMKARNTPRRISHELHLLLQGLRPPW